MDETIFDTIRNVVIRKKLLYTPDDIQTLESLIAERDDLLAQAKELDDLISEAKDKGIKPIGGVK
jgi:hypothetical protein